MRTRAAGRSALALVCALAAGSAGRIAAADPLFELPVVGKGGFGGAPGDAFAGGLVLDARIVGILGARRLAIWPDRELGLEPGDPVAAALRVGGVVRTGDAAWGLVLQADLAEFLRPGDAGEKLWRQDLGAFSGAVLDDAYLTWQPDRVLNVVLGRARVPFGKWRQFDERDLALGAAPFVVDRVAPDRRWGLLVHGDLGALAYAAGAWADDDALEPRAAEEDPSAGGRVAVSVAAEWTPIAPMMGSNPVGRVVGARGPLPTPRSDPWFDTTRFSLGLGVLWRDAADGAQRVDASLSLQWKWRWLAAIAEGLVVDSSHLGADAELAATPVDRLSLHLRGEWDPGEAHTAASGLPSHAAWTTGAGVMWHATEDRRSRIGVYGWIRRVDVGSSRSARSEDAAIVLIQTAL
jgi:hypothetical protein